MIESAWNIDMVVAIGSDDPVELLAIDGQRHFDVFDFLTLVVGQESA